MRNHFIIGVDEVGRGPLFGDVVVAAAILPMDNLVEIQVTDKLLGVAQADDVSLADAHIMARLTDSKKLSEKQREALFPLIQQTAIAYYITNVSPSKIDEMNILQATLLGMKTAITEIINLVNQRYAKPYDDVSFTVVVDGKQLPNLTDLPSISQIINQRAIVRGDGRHACISAASVLAKVSRDRQMVELAERFPEYGLDKHKGYPTLRHLQAIEQYGILPEHRRSFAPIKRRLQANALKTPAKK